MYNKATPAPPGTITDNGIKNTSRKILVSFRKMPLMPIFDLNSISGLIFAAKVPVKKSMTIAVQINAKMNKIFVSSVSKKCLK